MTFIFPSVAVLERLLEGIGSGRGSDPAVSILTSPAWRTPAEELDLVFLYSGNEKFHGQKRAQNMLNLRLKRIGVSGGPTRAANRERSFFTRPFMASSDTSHR